MVDVLEAGYVVGRFETKALLRRRQSQSAKQLRVHTTSWFVSMSIHHLGLGES